MSRPMRIADYFGVNRCAASAHSLRGPPHRVFGCRIAVPSRPREQTALDEELKELLVLESRRPFGHLTLGEKERRRSVSRPGVAHGLSATDEVEGILVLGAGKRVEGVASFAAKVATLRRRNDERKQAILDKQRAHRVDPRPAVGAHGRQERETDPKLVQERSAGLCQVGPDRAEAMPSHHGRTFTEFERKINVA